MLEPYGWFECGNDHDGVEMNVDVVCIPMFKAGTFVWIPTTAFTIIVI